MTDRCEGRAAHSQRRWRGAIRHGGWLLGGSGTQAVVSFASNLALVRLLAPEDFGRFAIVLATAGLSSTAINFRIDELILRERRLDEQRLGAYGLALLTESLLVLTLGIGILLASGLFGIEALLVLGSMVGTSWLAVQERLCERGFRYREFSVVQASAHVGAHLFAVVAAVAGLGALVLYLRDVVRLLLQAVGFAKAGSLRALPIRIPRRGEARELARRIRGFWGEGVLEQAFERLVILVVGALTGARTTGFFFQARRLAATPHQLLQPAAARLAFNYFSHRVPPERRRRTLFICLGALGLGLGCVCVGLWLTAGWIVPWLFGEQWAPVVPLLIAMSGVVLALTPLALVQAYFMALGRMGPMAGVGRASQYAAFGLAAVLALSGIGDPAVVLALGLSGAYVAGTLLPLLLVAVERPAPDHELSARRRPEPGLAMRPATEAGQCAE